MEVRASVDPNRQILRNKWMIIERCTLLCTHTDAIPVILEAKKVKGMTFVDYYGDPGRYTGEVNDANMPHGMGEITYDHGLVQGGKWVSARQLIELFV